MDVEDRPCSHSRLVCLDAAAAAARSEAATRARLRTLAIYTYGPVDAVPMAGQSARNLASQASAYVGTYRGRTREGN